MLRNYAPMAEFKAANEVPLKDKVFLLSNHELVDPVLGGLDAFKKSDFKGAVL